MIIPPPHDSLLLRTLLTLLTEQLIKDVVTELGFGRRQEGEKRKDAEEVGVNLHDFLMTMNLNPIDYM